MKINGNVECRTAKFTVCNMPLLKCRKKGMETMIEVYVDETKSKKKTTSERINAHYDCAMNDWRPDATHRKTFFFFSLSFPNNVQFSCFNLDHTLLLAVKFRLLFWCCLFSCLSNFKIIREVFFLFHLIRFDAALFNFSRIDWWSITHRPLFEIRKEILIVVSPFVWCWLMNCMYVLLFFYWNRNAMHCVW